MLFFLVFIILVLAATSLALPRGSHLPRTTPADSVEEHEDEHVQALPADRPENAPTTGGNRNAAVGLGYFSSYEASG